MALVQLTDAGLAELAADVRNAFPDLDADEQRIALALYRLLAEGTPVAVEQIVQATGVAPTKVAQAVSEWWGVHRNAGGEVTAFRGLTVDKKASPHRLHVKGERLATWCAWDTLFLPGLLDTVALVESVCAATGEQITVTVGPRGVEEITPPETVISFLRPDGKFDHDIILSFCHHVLFFTSEQAGAEWAAGRPNALLMPLGQGFELGRRVFQDMFADVLVSASA